jgi:DNA-binding transcriptional LysR family regulator
MLREVDLNLLFVFQQVMQSKNISIAAKELGLSQPAVSRSFQRLRNVLKDELLVRNSGASVLTPLATTLEPLVEHILSLCHECFFEKQKFDLKNVHATFTIASADYGQALLLPSLASYFSTAAPGLRINMVPIQEPRNRMLSDGVYDLVLAPKTKMEANIVSTELFKDNFVFALRSRHKQLKSKQFSLNDFLSIPHVAIAPQGTAGNPLDEQLAQIGTKRKAMAQVSSFFVAANMVAHSDLGAAFPKHIFDLVSKSLKLKSLALPISVRGFSIWQYWHEKNRNDALHKAVRHAVVECSAGLRG